MRTCFVLLIWSAQRETTNLKNLGLIEGVNYFPPLSLGYGSKFLTAQIDGWNTPKNNKIVCSLAFICVYNVLNTHGLPWFYKPIYCAAVVVFGGGTWRIIPFSKWVITMVRGTWRIIPFSKLSITMVSKS